MERVCVLLSTYNGEKFIKTQVHSILNQTNVCVEIIIRDDGSTDNTVKIIKDFQLGNTNIKLLLGENIGYAKSFLTLLTLAPNTYDYYAFADQDDVWDCDKLYCAIQYIGKCTIPILYGCNLRLVDEGLNFISEMKVPRIDDFEKGRYLIDKYGYGCTMVLNQALRKLVICSTPSSGISHDNWVGLVAVFCGEFLFDNSCHISYRQHDQNVTGGRDSFYSKWKRRLKNLTQITQLSRSIIAKDLLDNFSDLLDKSSIELLTMVATYKESIFNRVTFFFDKRTVRKSFEKNFLFRIQILLGLA